MTVQADANVPKICPRCLRELVRADFYRCKGEKDGRTSHCKNCHRASVERYESHKPEKRKAQKDAYIKRWRPKTKYDLSLDEYECMSEAQGHACAICGMSGTRTAAGTTYALAVDHDRITGKIGALLRGLCNRALGTAKDRPELLGRAAAYVERHKESHARTRSTTNKVQPPQRRPEATPSRLRPRIRPRIQVP